MQYAISAVCHANMPRACVSALLNLCVCVFLCPTETCGTASASSAAVYKCGELVAAFVLAI